MSDTTIDTNVLGEKVVRVLKTIFDPEIPVDIYELGLIYDVFVNEEVKEKREYTGELELEGVELLETTNKDNDNG